MVLDLSEYGPPYIQNSGHEKAGYTAPVLPEQSAFCLSQDIRLLRSSQGFLSHDMELVSYFAIQA